MKKLIILICAVFIIGVYTVSSKQANEVQSIDGGQRNQIQSGGGGGTSGAQTNAVNVWTAPQELIGTYNTLGASDGTSTNFFNGIVIGNTNAAASPYLWNIRQSGSRRVINFDAKSNGGDFYLYVGNQAQGGGYLTLDWNNSAAEILTLGGNFPLYIGAANRYQITFNSTGTSITYGDTTSHAHIWNGGTHTIADNPQVNTDVWKWASAGGTLTNGTSLTVMQTLTTTNLVARGGVTLAYRACTVNTTNTATDYYLSWSATVGQATNFLATGSAAGRTLEIKDALGSATTTNIIIKPLSTDTIDKASSYNLNGNFNAIKIVYDGTSNWEVR